MTGLTFVAAALFVAGLFTRSKLRSRYPASLVYVMLALCTGVFAGLSTYLVLDVPVLEAVGVGAAWALVMVAMPLGNLVHDRLSRDQLE